MNNGVLFTFSGVTNLPLTNPSVLFTPASYGANLRAWFAADQGVTVSNGLAILMQGLGPASGLSLVGHNGGLPILSNAQNGLPGLQSLVTNAADSTIQSMVYSLSETDFCPSLNFNWNTPFTVSLAVKASTSMGNNFIIGQGNTQRAGWFVGYRFGQFALYLFGSGGYGQNWLSVHSGFYPVSGTAYSLEMVYTGATGTAADVTFYVNGVQTTGQSIEANGTLTGGIQSAGDGVPFAINPALQFGFADETTVLEVVVASTAALPAQAVGLEKYLNTKWAIHS